MNTNRVEEEALVAQFPLFQILHLLQALGPPAKNTEKDTLISNKNNIRQSFDSFSKRSNDLFKKIGNPVTKLLQSPEPLLVPLHFVIQLTRVRVCTVKFRPFNDKSIDMPLQPNRHTIYAVFHSSACMMNVQCIFFMMSFCAIFTRQV